MCVFTKPTTMTHVWHCLTRLTLEINSRTTGELNITANIPEMKLNTF